MLGRMALGGTITFISGLQSVSSGITPRESYLKPKCCTDSIILVIVTEEAGGVGGTGDKDMDRSGDDRV